MHLTKHHGLANDFLVVVDERDERAPGAVIDGELARRLCDRRTGVGADGLIHGQRPGADSPAEVVMNLFNADGSRAEMSGNGIRCLAHALAIARHDSAGTSYLIATDGGLRKTELVALDGPVAVVQVSMGPVQAGPDVPVSLAELLKGRYVTLDLGNPHLVIEVDDPTVVDLETEGAWLEQQFPRGINVEYVHADNDERIVMRVWERGAGITEACGTGACAAAHAAHGWGLVGERVSVVMPGGRADVVLGDDVLLRGPSELVADIEVADG